MLTRKGVCQGDVRGRGCDQGVRTSCMLDVHVPNALTHTATLSALTHTATLCQKEAHQWDQVRGDAGHGCSI